MPYNPNHQHYTIQFDYPGGDNLQVKSIEGKEKLSGLFKFQMDLVANDGDLDFKKLVGQSVTAKLNVDDGGSKGDGGFRYFNGIVTDFTYLGSEYTDIFRYRATVRPWFWLLTRTTDCRIFQNKTVPDIIKEVFKLNNMVDFQQNLKATYREWEYCVQYNETDYDFVSRLLEQEGIYYYFKHEDGKHVMVMVDELSSHEDYPGFESVVFNAGFAKGSIVEDSLHYCAATKHIKPGTYTIQDYDFKNPKADLLAKYKNDPESGYEYPLADPEIFNYPGEYVVRNEGNSYAEIRLQELQCRWDRTSAAGDCRGLAPGFTFTLKESPRSEQNKKYLTVSIKHKMRNSDYRAGQSNFESDEETIPYQCEIEAIDAQKIRFRPPRVTPKPIVQGPQTAMVVGPSGDEIYTDEYGRIKVQFHWDRYGQNDENSSCWMRVAQIWAGTKWGGIHIPRIGQEVVVNFLEGDPDRPLITGSVYNANTMPPYTLEANKTQSGIKSRSTTGGSADNFNEIRMEDKIGSEELYIQAEKDENILVKNNKSENVGNNETITIGNDRTETVGHDETITVQNNRVETVQVNETLTVGTNRTRNVGANESVTVGSSRTHNVGVNEMINIGIAQEITVGAAQAITVGAAQAVTVGGPQSIEVGASRSLDVGSDYNVNVGSDRNSQIGNKESVNVGKEWVVDVGDSITLKCGSAQIVMKKDGTIQLKGNNISLKASGKIEAKASATLTLKGSSIKEN